ncbi:MAG: type II secretion system protein GspG [Candidatus Parabeggiatoa sp.]|nr:type II secretion system protein GspG [Candidatus Parabeggiatoa sp.]
MFPISKRKINQHSGITLIELLIELTILALLAIFVGPHLFKNGRPSPEKVALANIESAIEIYRLDMSEYPKTLEGLIKNETDDLRWRGPYLNKGIISLDLWKNSFQYQILGPDSKDYDLYSYGADGILGGEGEAADIRNVA